MIFKNIIIFILAIGIVSSCQIRSDSESIIKKGNKISAKTLFFHSSNLNLDSLKYVVLLQYVKNTNFNKLIRVDTFSVQPQYYQKDEANKIAYWAFSIEYPAIDSTIDIYSYDYELRLEKITHKKFKYSDILIKTEKTTVGYIYYIDSLKYNGIAIKNSYGANVLGIW
jgi:hypothetical protein